MYCAFEIQKTKNEFLFCSYGLWTSVGVTVCAMRQYQSFEFFLKMVDIFLATALVVILFSFLLLVTCASDVV